MTFWCRRITKQISSIGFSIAYKEDTKEIVFVFDFFKSCLGVGIGVKFI